jgi:NhaA family Na+:H+ antiporter
MSDASHAPAEPLAQVVHRRRGVRRVLLIAVAALAMALANSPLAAAYHALFHGPLPWTPIASSTRRIRGSTTR